MPGLVTKNEFSQELLDEFNDKDASLKTLKTNKDAEGIFTTVEKRRLDGTLAIKSILSGGISPKYTTRTITYYATNGTTITNTVTLALTYDSDNELISEV